MNVAEIIIIVLLSTLMLMIILCFIDFKILEIRYRNFYLKTEEGHELHRLLTTKKKLQHEYDYWNARLNTLEVTIDKRKYQFPDLLLELDTENLKKDYSDTMNYLEIILIAYVGCNNKIIKLIGSLPNKYKGILNYNWELVEIEEEKI